MVLTRFNHFLQEIEVAQKIQIYSNQLQNRYIKLLSSVSCLRNAVCKGTCNLNSHKCGDWEVFAQTGASVNRKERVKPETTLVQIPKMLKKY